MSIDTPPAPAVEAQPLTDAELEQKLETGGSRESLAEVRRSKYGSKPLAALFALFMFDEFDTGAFNVLAPDIQRDFDLSDQRFGTIVILNVTVVLLLAIPVGYLGDRYKRIPLIAAGGLLAGVFSLLTGIVGTVALLVAVRMGNGVGRLVNDPIHTSLLSDYYPPAQRPLVFSLHRNATYVGAILGSIIAGVVASLFGWRVAFMILLLPIAVAAYVAFRLPEPRRGESDDAQNAEEAEKEAPVSFTEARRTLFTVKTLKRNFTSSVFFGAGLIPLAVYLPLYFEEEYGLGPASRGVIVALSNVATLLGLLVGGAMLPRWLAKDPGLALKRGAVSGGVIGIVLLGFAAAQGLVLAVGIILIGYFAVGVLIPATVTVQSLVSPARVRSLSYAYGAIYSLGGGIFFFFSPLGAISDDYGIRWGVAAAAPFFLIGAAVLYTAAPFVRADAEKGLASLAFVSQMRAARLQAGQRSLLVCRGVDVSYGDVQVLFGVDLEVGEGELVALLGTNGAGKSTLLKAISGLVDPRDGAIFFDGQDITHADPLRRMQLGVVQMPGGRSVFPTLTVRECLRLAGWSRRDEPEDVAAATAAALEEFPRLTERMDQLAGDLSGGEQQQLGLAMALVAKPRLLMIDELSLGLSPVVVGQLIEVVRRISDTGTTVIVVEQSVNVALTLCRRAVFMEKGEVRFSGPTADLLEREDVLRSVFLQGTAAALGDQPSATTVVERQRLDDARDLVPALQVSDLSVRFGGIRAVNGVSFSVAPREVLGIIGPNGAGKTTVFDLVCGFLEPTGGRIGLAGEDVTGDAPARRFAAGLGRSFQDARIFPSLTVAENIAVALERTLEVRDPVSAMFGLPALLESEEAAAWQVHELIGLLGLDAYRNKFAGELSTGSRRMVDLAMVVAHRPSVLLLDEPSSGIAQREAEALGPALLAVRDRLGCALVVIEHDMPLIQGVSDRLLALDTGTVVVDGLPADVVNHPQVVASYLGDNTAAVQRSGGQPAAEPVTLPVQPRTRRPRS